MKSKLLGVVLFAGLAAMVAQAKQEGELAVFEGPLAGILGVEESTQFKVLHFPRASDGLSHSVYSGPKQNFLATLEVRPSLEQKRYFRVSDRGVLEQVVVISDRLDKKGVLKPNGRKVESLNIGSRDVAAWFEKEREYYRRDPRPRKKRRT